MVQNNIPYISEYEEYLTLEKRLSQNTIKSYLGDITNFFHYSPFDCKPQSFEAESESIRKYMENLESLGTAPRTINRKLSSIKGLFNYLLSEEIIPKSPFTGIKPPKIQKYKPDHLDHHEMDKIYESIDTQKKGGRRDLCLIDLLYGAGLRISEAINLPVDRVLLNENLLNIQGKGGKQRLVPIGKKVKNSIVNFLKLERSLLNIKSPNLVTNLRGGSLSRMGAWKLIQKIMINTDIKKKIHPHTFRHTYASHLIEAGADLRAVQELLGHSDISTTEIYTHLNQDYLFEVHQSFHPRNH